MTRTGDGEASKFLPTFASRAGWPSHQQRRLQWCERRMMRERELLTEVDPTSAISHELENKQATMSTKLPDSVSASLRRRLDVEGERRAWDLGRPCLACELQQARLSSLPFSLSLTTSSTSSTRPTPLLLFYTNHTTRYPSFPTFSLDR